jgi:hypothetical protein
VLEKIYLSILVGCGALVYKRTKKKYITKFGSQPHVMLVGGNVGKSTTTLLIANLLKQSGITVLTGTSVQKNYNSLSGLLGTLLSKQQLLEQGLWGQIKLIVLSILPWSYANMDQNTWLVQEVGVDEQGGMKRYVKIFGEVEFYISTMIAAEHTFAYTSTPQPELIESLKPLLPKSLLKKIVQETNLVLQNGYLEQLLFLPYSKHWIIPSAVGIQFDSIIISQGGTQIKQKLSSTYQNTQLYSAGLLVPKPYLVPPTFKLQLGIASQIQLQLTLKKEDLETVLSKLKLPYGRFGLFEGKSPFSKIIDSTYNSDPASLDTFLDMVQDFESHAKHHALVLGAMRELGKESDHYHLVALHQLIKLYKKIPSTVLLVGEHWKIPLSTLGPTEFVHLMSVKGVLGYLRNLETPADSWLWCKGSQNTLFLEEVVKHYLYNTRDHSFLCRQSPQWMQKKQEYL